MDIGMWLSSFGILATLCGSWLVAYEVVNKFSGATYSVSTGWGGSGSPKRTELFVQWENMRNRVMWTGLGFITIGSLLQLAGLAWANVCTFR